MFGPHDGVRVRVHPYRRMMKFLMRGRNESAVYFEQQIDVSTSLPWIDAWNRSSGKRATVFHLVMFALGRVLHERERLNRFTVGHRTYQRKGVFLSYAAKKAMSDDAPLATVKREVAKDTSFADVVDLTNGDVGSAKSSTPSAMDKELSILLALPSFVLVFLLGLLKRLYTWGLAPRSLVDTDPLYTSAFIANLGSIKLDAAYHHLYEHGNCPLFVTIGRVVDGKLSIKYTYDERVEDGFYAARALQRLAEIIENPAEHA